jgi:hypothetical protein
MNMYRGGSSRLFPALLILVVIIVAIIALVAVGRALFGGSGDEPETSPSRRALLTTDADHSIRMTVRGPLVAEENFRSYQIDVSPVNRRVSTYKGYQSQQLDEKQFNNNTEAYTEFVNALYRANFLREARLSEEQDDTRGVCATGRLYVFEIMEAQSSIKRLWTSSCKDGTGSFRGNSEQVRNLFLKQVPDSDAALRTIDLSA